MIRMLSRLLSGESFLEQRDISDVNTQSKSKRSWTDAMHIGSI